MSDNTNLHKAKKNKNDEFYTKLDDIEKELENYKQYFKDKIVYLNCDNPDKSKFWVYFKEHFKELELRKLIATYYDEQAAYKAVFDNNTNRKTKLNGNGDFRSGECEEILKECDIVVTNPPFSLYRDFIDLLVKHNKQFLIIGTINSALCKNIFPLLRDGKMWYGYNPIKKFDTPDGITDKVQGMCRWYTNLGQPHPEPLKMTKKYNNYYDEDGFLREDAIDIYHKFDEFDAINVDKMADIPCDYKGVMGVPITYIQKHDPKIFDIGTYRFVDNKPVFFTMDFAKQFNDIDKAYPPCITGRVAGLFDGHVEGKEKYIRILIKRKE